jgi:hypothetical protein
MRSNSPLQKTKLGAMAYEHSFDARVRDVSKPALARLASLGNWPSFDLLSDRAGDGASVSASTVAFSTPTPGPLNPRDDLDSVHRRFSGF